MRSKDRLQTNQHKYITKWYIFSQNSFFMINLNDIQNAIRFKMLFDSKCYSITAVFSANPA